MSEIAIKVYEVNKSFRLPHETHGSIKNMFVNIFRGRTTYEKQEVLKGISFEVQKGEFFGIVGRNGSGKSTLLKLLAGVYSPNNGTISVNGKLTPFIELGVGFNPELTGRENVFLNGSLLGFSREEMEDMYDEIVEFAELERFMDQKLKNYSSGMQVRLAFSIAIRANGDILLLDEVLAVGDEAFQRKCYNYFTKLKKGHQTVILVTHDMSAVEKYCDRAMMLESNKILHMGKPRDVALRYEAANSNVDIKPKSRKRATTSIIRIKEITLDNQGNTTKIKISFHAIKKEKIQFNLYLVNADGEYLAGINTTKDLKDYMPEKGNNSLTCVLENGQLPKGEYSINVGVYTLEDNPKMLDVMDASYGSKVPTIKIIEKSSFRDGKFYLAAKWQKE